MNIKTMNVRQSVYFTGLGIAIKPVFFTEVAEGIREIQEKARAEHVL
jgi:hypothetical protein